MKANKKSWQSKRIDAINRVIKRSSSPSSWTEYFIEEYDLVINSKAKSKREYKYG